MAKYNENAAKVAEFLAEVGAGAVLDRVDELGGLLHEVGDEVAVPDALRHGVVPAVGKGIAAKHPPRRKHKALCRAVRFDGLYGITRAGGRIPAAGS